MSSAGASVCCRALPDPLAIVGHPKACRAAAPCVKCPSTCECAARHSTALKTLLVVEVLHSICRFRQENVYEHGAQQQRACDHLMQTIKPTPGGYRFEFSEPCNKYRASSRTS